jgi:hypothetical protein
MLRMEKPTIESKIEKGAERIRKTFLYHMVPQDMRGATLHPLNSLKEIHPDLYIKNAAEYEGREHVMKRFLPTLEAAWNDVLHFTAVNPGELKAALLEAGLEPREMKFYQIDPNLLDPERTTVFLCKNEEMHPENFTTYDPKKLEEHASLREETRSYYKEMSVRGERPLLFVGIPHILHKGSMDISNLPVIVV